MAGETRVTKEVKMVGYDADKSFGGTREFANELIERDLMQTSKSEDREVSIELNLGGTKVTKDIWEHRYTEDKLTELKDMADGDIMTVHDDNKIRTEHKFSMTSAGSEFAEIICEALPDVIELENTTLEVDEGHFRRLRWQNEENTVTFKVSPEGFSRRRILSKEGKRESDDLYETMAEVPSFCININMKADDSAIVDEMSDDVIPELHKAMARVPELGKVRYTECERQERVKGECYDI